MHRLVIGRRKDLEKRLVLAVFLALVFAISLIPSFRIQMAKAATIVVPDNYPTIQDAVYAATDGDSIYVRSGVYYESLVVNKSVSLMGENKYSTFINASKDSKGRPVYIDSVEGVTISGFTLCNSSATDFGYGGIVTFEANRCKIVGNIFTDNLDGIFTWYSTNNIISDNLFYDNSWNGVHLRDESQFNTVSSNVILTHRNGLDIENNASNNYIYGNDVRGDRLGGDGIDIFGCQNETIVGNNFTDTFSGIMTSSASSGFHKVFHNNFVNNYYQATSYSINDEWDNGYPSGGNYWSDYNGNDSRSGAYQNETGSDGIGDTPYTIDGNSTDRYPLMHPFFSLAGDMNHDDKVDIFDGILAARCFGSVVGDSAWNSEADFNKDGTVDIFDLILLARNFGTTYHP